MAVPSILPQDADHASRVQTIHDEITELAHDLMHDEPFMLFFEATVTAGQMIEELEAYATVWDNIAFFAGNDDAMPF